MTIQISKKLVLTLFAVIMLLTVVVLFGAKKVEAAGKPDTQVVAKAETPVLFEPEAEVAAPAADSTSAKAYAAAIAIAISAAAGAIAMGMAIGKSAESISRQPEAAGEIRTSLMLGLVFIETAIIYALIVTILIIFVM